MYTIRGTVRVGINLFIIWQNTWLCVYCLFLESVIPVKNTNLHDGEIKENIFHSNKRSSDIRSLVYHNVPWIGLREILLWTAKAYGDQDKQANYTHLDSFWLKYT